MKLIVLAIGIILFASISCATPFLCADPSATPISSVEIEVTAGGITTVYTGTYIVSGSDIRLLDLVGYANGSYIFRARWADASGWWSDWSTPLNAVKSGKPGNFRIK
jgi:hypothetical protein